MATLFFNRMALTPTNKMDLFLQNQIKITFFLKKEKQKIVT
jgi:hypothetical protein